MGVPVVLLCVLHQAGTALAAESPRFTLAVAGGTQSLTVPWHVGPVAGRLNPTLMVGTERTLKPGDRWRLYQTANVGFFQHHWWMTGLSLDTEVGLGRALPLGLHADLRLGLGYLHYFWRRQGFALRDGRYVHKTDLGRPSFLVPLAIVLGHRGRSSRTPAISPFICGRWAIQVLFLDDAPVMTHLHLLAGVRLQWGGRGAARAGGQ